ncbi:Chemotaxis protein CheA [compost metagenome]
MSLEFDAEDFQAFLEEARSHLDTLEQGLLTLEDMVGEALDIELLNEMFRGAHSIKGAAGMLGLKTVAALTHQMENLLGAIRAGKHTLTPRGVEVLFESVDALGTLLVELGGGTVGNGLDITPTVQALKEILEGEHAPAASSTDDPPYAFDAAYMAGMSPKHRALLDRLDAESRFLYEVQLDLADCRWGDETLDHAVMEKLYSLGEVIALLSDPAIPAHAPGAGPFPVKGTALFVTTAEPAILGILLPFSSDQIAVVHAPGAAPAPAPESPAAPASPAAQDSPAPQDSAPAAPAASAPASPAATASVAASTVPAAKDTSAVKKAAAQQSIRVDVERLDLLMEVVGELVIGNTRLAQLGSELENRYDREPLVGTLNETIAQVARLMSELQLTVMRVRMIPVERVFSKFPRLIRDLAKSMNKEIRLEIFGQDTELDKTVVEELEDPLVHLLRNAADHGVETPDVREANGKSRIGTIRLGAHREGNHIVISIADDGGGINPEKILAKARKMGIATVDGTYTDMDALQFIFHPGFSTAEKVTDVSGRGVGMDVVNQNIRKIKGTIQVVSKVGEGSKFIIKLPLTLAITKALLIKAGGDFFAIPLDAVKESIRVANSDIKTVNQREVIQLRDRVVPLFRLTHAFGLKPEPRASRYSPVVIVGGDNKQIGLVVDSLEGEQDVVIKSMGDYLGEIRGVAGATILGDGRVALILDIATLIDEGEGKDRHEAGAYHAV